MRIKEINKALFGVAKSTILNCLIHQLELEVLYVFIIKNFYDKLKCFSVNYFIKYTLVVNGKHSDVKNTAKRYFYRPIYTYRS